MMEDKTKELYIELCALLQTPRDFEVGDFVTWKHPAMAHKARPKAGESLIVTEIFDMRRDFESESGSVYYYEPLDMKIGIITDGGDFVEYAVDSRRFKKAD